MGFRLQTFEKLHRLSRGLRLCRGFGGGGCCNQGGIDHGAGLEQQAALAQNDVDQAQHLLCQFVFLQPVAWTWGFAKGKTGGLIRRWPAGSALACSHCGARWQLGEFDLRYGFQNRLSSSRSFATRSFSRNQRLSCGIPPHRTQA